MCQLDSSQVCQRQSELHGGGASHHETQLQKRDVFPHQQYFLRSVCRQRQHLVGALQNVFAVPRIRQFKVAAVGVVVDGEFFRTQANVGRRGAG